MVLEGDEREERGCSWHTTMPTKQSVKAKAHSPIKYFTSWP